MTARAENLVNLSVLRANLYIFSLFLALMQGELRHLQTKRELFFDYSLKTANIKLLIAFQVRRAES